MFSRSASTVSGQARSQECCWRSTTRNCSTCSRILPVFRQRYCVYCCFYHTRVISKYEKRNVLFVGGWSCDCAASTSNENWSLQEIGWDERILHNLTCHSLSWYTLGAIKMITVRMEVWKATLQPYSVLPYVKVKGFIILQHNGSQDTNLSSWRRPQNLLSSLLKQVVICWSYLISLKLIGYRVNRI